MSLISDRNHEKLLKEKNINIKTIFSDGDKLYEKNTDNTRNDSISKGVIVEKDYSINNVIKRKTYGFDPRIEYSFIISEQIGSTYDCPNCRMITKITKEIERCPFCGSHYNLDYKNKDLGSKTHYDRITHDNKFMIKISLLVLFVSFSIAYLYLSKVSRTFNMYDVLKVIGLGLVLALVVFFILYLLDGLVVLLPIKIKKDRINKKDKELWISLNNKNISYISFYNNLHYELDKYYYVDNKSNIIDYDIIDYYSFSAHEDAANMFLDLTLVIREIRLVKDKIELKVYERQATFKKNIKPVTVIDDGEIHTINCHNCGASIDVTSEKCNFCDTPNNYNQEWYLIKIK